MKTVLFTPGPTMTPDFIWRAMKRSQMHHRDPYYLSVLGEVRTRMKQLLGLSRGDIVFLRGGGTEMMDVVAASVATENSSFIINTGYFGTRWRHILMHYDRFAAENKTPWGETYSTEALRQFLNTERSEHMLVFMQTADTSTGIRNDMGGIAHILSQRGISKRKALIADAVLEAGVSKINMDSEKIDILVSTSQKAFLLPPGMGFIAVQQRIIETMPFIERGYSLNLRAELAASAAGTVRHTPPTCHVVGLLETLKFIERIGETEWYRTHERRALRLRTALQELGFSLYTRGPATNAMSVLTVPPRRTSSAIKDALGQKGFIIEQGLGDERESVIRIAHFWGTAKSDGALIAAVKKVLE